MRHPYQGPSSRMSLSGPGRRHQGRFSPASPAAFGGPSRRPPLLPNGPLVGTRKRPSRSNQETNFSDRGSCPAAGSGPQSALLIAAKFHRSEYGNILLRGNTGGHRNRRRAGGGMSPQNRKSAATGSGRAPGESIRCAHHSARGYASVTFPGGVKVRRVFTCFTLRQPDLLLSMNCSAASRKVQPLATATSSPLTADGRPPGAASRDAANRGRRRPAGR
jgi:hypothetical protein